jgi:hypothetical protein
MATIRPAMLRSLARLACTASRGGARLPAPRLGGAAVSLHRGYKSKTPQPMRDVMTGEIIQLPDIDVRSPFTVAHLSLERLNRVR